MLSLTAATIARRNRDLRNKTAASASDNPPPPPNPQPLPNDLPLLNGLPSPYRLIRPKTTAEVPGGGNTKGVAECGGDDHVMEGDDTQSRAAW